MVMRDWRIVHLLLLLTVSVGNFTGRAQTQAPSPSISSNSSAAASTTLPQLANASQLQAPGCELETLISLGWQQFTTPPAIRSYQQYQTTQTPAHGTPWDAWQA